MNFKRLTNALRRAGLDVQNGKHNSRFYFCKNKERVLEFYVQDESAICIKSRRVNDHDDAMIDYSAGYFCKTIKDAVNSLIEA